MRENPIRDCRAMNQHSVPKLRAAARQERRQILPQTLATLLSALILSTSSEGLSAMESSDEAQSAYNHDQYPTPLEFRRTLAELGDAVAQYELGVMYSKGYGVPRNYSAAVTWFRKAALQGHLDAQYNLGAMYADGRGVRQDFAEAVKWYREAAEHGHPNAQASLGAMYALGRGVPGDDAAALAWFRKAADEGDAGAQYNLGAMYADGRGMPQDLALAAAWYRKAADQGNASARSEVDPVSWTPDYLSFRSLRWQGNTHPMRRSSAGRW